MADRPDEGRLSGMRWMVVAALLLCLTCSTLNAQGQTDDPQQADFPGLDIQAVPGWDGYVDLAAPVPFSFLISNFSQDTIEGELTLTNPEDDRTLSLGEIFIGPNSVRRFSSIQAVPDWYQCIARFSHDGRVLWQRELALTTGKDFSEDLNYLLFVDDGTRQLQLPISENGGGGTGRLVLEVGYGRAVQPLGVKTWQIPQHPGPLTVAQAIVFSETTKVDMLNDAQWDAVGKWICLGGTVFVHDKSTELIERLKKVTPLAAQPEILFQELTTHRCGTGSIREYAGPLFSATDVTTPWQIGESASRLSRYTTMSMLESTDLTYWESRNSEINRMWVVTVFVVYTLLSSSAILLFRLSRRNITIFTSVVVGLTCVAAVVLGGVLRTSRGDLRWVTITSAGSGGLLQLGKIDVQSAGGRNTQMTVNGRDADLQLSESDDIRTDYYYGYYYQPRITKPHFPSFTWQASQLEDQADAYQVNVPINPWGRRRLYATAYQPLERGVDIEVTYSLPETLPPEQAAQLGATYGLNGTFRVKATSHLPFDLENCRLIIARTQVSSDVQATTYSTPFPGANPSPQNVDIQMEQVNSLGDFGRLSPSIPVTVESAPGTHMTTETLGAQMGQNTGEAVFPKVAHDGATSVWIVAQISKSPILSIDQQRSDFESLQEQHWYVQEVLPEQVPQEWRDLTERLLKEQLAAVAAAKIDQPR
ncbi:MAG: hypothetical protein DWI29_02465 [Planctomycetota bacterium]|nr:MAG: hypothetical protein DWI29_02465 [Planctomycetota bacterium]